MTLSQQSPINLQDPIFADLGERGLQLHWSGKVFGKVVRHGDAIKVDINHDDKCFVDLDQKTFHLIGYHFHHPSEHWVKGEQRTMELHVVHQNINDGTYAVVGIFLQVASESPSKPVLRKFIADVARILKSLTDPSADCRISTSPKDFLPEAPEEYYRYEGSLTTPQDDGKTFLETVSWVVLKNPVLMNASDLNDLIKEFIEPARFLQPLNRRFVLATFQTPSDSAKTKQRRQK